MYSSPGNTLYNPGKTLYFPNGIYRYRFHFLRTSISLLTLYVQQFKIYTFNTSYLHKSKSIYHLCENPENKLKSQHGQRKMQTIFLAPKNNEWNLT